MRLCILIRDCTMCCMCTFCTDILCRYRTALSDRHKNLTWPGFVEAVLERDGYDNIHWTPQHRFCGLQRFHPLLNFVGNFEKLREHGALLIAKAGLHEASKSFFLFD